MSYTLANVEERNRENPKTFLIAPREVREKIGVDDLAQLIFEFDQGDGAGRVGERMWVKVIRRTEDGYEGMLQNHPAHSGHGLAFDAPIRFQPEHIAQAECRHQKSQKE